MKCRIEIDGKLPRKAGIGKGELKRAAEFFGFYNIFGKFAAVLGPALVGVSGWLLGGGQYGMFSLMLLFAAGGWLLGRTKID